jgi:hypothetical protein
VAGVKRTAKWAACLLAAWVGLALALEVFTAVAQPEFNASDGVLRTFDAAGTPHDTQLAVLDDDTGAVWVQSGHYFRGWYERALANPEVELVRGGETRSYRAVPIDTPETETHVTALLKRRGGPLRYYAIRSLLLFADIKPVRLDPR